MAAIIPKHILEEIRLHSDIVDVIGSYVPLKRAGGGMKALCPFHKEKTPSFNVNAHRQIFHCFGCGEGGDVFSFVMRHEGVDFTTATRMLAHRAGIQLELEERDPGERTDKDILYKLLDELARLYSKTLLESKAASGARTYLKERDIGEDIISDFKLGFAPNQSHLLVPWAKKSGYTIKHLESAGMVGRSEKGDEVYDRFRGRLMFPIHDELDRVVGFSGRILESGATVAKYINSPETVLFKKSRILYGLNRARHAFVDSRKAILCEGQIDVIRCHHAGILNAVAPQGTAFTEDHARLLKRYADAVVLVFDADEAGRKAALKSAEIFLGAGMSVNMVLLPEGEDPDSLIRTSGAGAFNELINQAMSVVDFQISALRSTVDLGSAEGQLRAARSVMDLVDKVSDEVQRDQIIRRASSQLGISDIEMRKNLRRASRRRYTATVPTQEAATERREHPPEEVALVELLIEHSELRELVRGHVQSSDLSDPVCQTLAMRLLENTEPGELDLSEALVNEGPECKRLAARVQLSPRITNTEESSAINAARDLILLFRRKSLERKRTELKSKMNQATPEERAGLNEECLQLTHDIHLFKQGWEKAAPILDLQVH